MGVRDGVRVLVGVFVMVGVRVTVGVFVGVGVRDAVGVMLAVAVAVNDGSRQLVRIRQRLMDSEFDRTGRRSSRIEWCRTVSNSM